MATSVTGNSNSCLFLIHGRTTNTCYLIDMGAEISTFPLTWHDKHHHASHTFTLQAANNTPICTFGTKLVTLNNGL